MEAELENARHLPEEAKINSWPEADPNTDTLGLLAGIKDFSPLTGFPNLRRLWVWAANQQQLELIGRLTNLESLTVTWLRSVKDLEPLGNLANLQVLYLEGSVKGISLEPIARLTNLRVLCLNALMSSAVNGGAVTCESFKPLAEPVSLEYLQLFFIKPLDKDLSPLTRLKSLKLLGIPNIFPIEDMAMLAAALPNTKGLFRISHEVFVDNMLRCKKCGGNTRVRLTGTAKGRPRLPCTVCDAAAIQQHVAEYEELREKFARELG